MTCIKADCMQIHSAVYCQLPEEHAEVSTTLYSYARPPVGAPPLLLTTGTDDADADGSAAACFDGFDGWKRRFPPGVGRQPPRWLSLSQPQPQMDLRQLIRAQHISFRGGFVLCVWPFGCVCVESKNKSPTAKQLVGMYDRDCVTTYR